MEKWSVYQKVEWGNFTTKQYAAQKRICPQKVLATIQRQVNKGKFLFIQHTQEIHVLKYKKKIRKPLFANCKKKREIRDQLRLN